MPGAGIKCRPHYVLKCLLPRNIQVMSVGRKVFIIISHFNQMVFRKACVDIRASIIIVTLCSSSAVFVEHLQLVISLPWGKHNSKMLPQELPGLCPPSQPISSPEFPLEGQLISRSSQTLSNHCALPHIQIE